MPLCACECTARILNGAEHKAVFAKWAKMLISVSDRTRTGVCFHSTSISKICWKVLVKKGLLSSNKFGKCQVKQNGYAGCSRFEAISVT